MIGFRGLGFWGITAGAACLNAGCAGAKSEPETAVADAPEASEVGSAEENSASPVDLDTEVLLTFDGGNLPAMKKLVKRLEAESPSFESETVHQMLDLLINEHTDEGKVLATRYRILRATASGAGREAKGTLEECVEVAPRHAPMCKEILGELTE